MPDHFRIIGALGSPYSMKMRAVLRYRRLPHAWVTTDPRARDEIAHVRPPVIPVIQFPDGEYHVDSTPMIDELELLHSGTRSVVPDDAAVAFLAYLVEDFADEWMTKMMFHYRWDALVDRETCSRRLAFDANPGASAAEIEKMAALFRERQVDRMPLVGCTEQNRELIERTYMEVLEILESRVTEQRFLFGTRPSRADFALYGQLSQLASDPTPSAVMRESAPYVYRWLSLLDDASGVDGRWDDAAGQPASAIKAFLRLIGEVYLPFLAANAAAFAAGRERFSCELRGTRYEQPTFKYQVKCLDRLRARYGELDDDARSRVDDRLRSGPEVPRF